MEEEEGDANSGGVAEDDLPGSGGGSDSGESRPGGQARGRAAGGGGCEGGHDRELAPLIRPWVLGSWGPLGPGCQTENDDDAKDDDEADDRNEEDERDDEDGDKNND